MIPEKLASTHCVSPQPLRWRLGEDVPQRAIQGEGRSESPEFSNTYTRNNPENAGMVSRKLAETGKIGHRQPVQGTVWVEHRSINATSELGYANGFLPLGVSVVRDCVC